MEKVVADDGGTFPTLALRHPCTTEGKGGGEEKRDPQARPPASQGNSLLGRPLPRSLEPLCDAAAPADRKVETGAAIALRAMDVGEPNASTSAMNQSHSRETEYSRDRERALPM